MKICHGKHVLLGHHCCKVGVYVQRNNSCIRRRLGIVYSISLIDGDYTTICTLYGRGGQSVLLIDLGVFHFLMRLIFTCFLFFHLIFFSIVTPFDLLNGNVYFFTFLVVRFHCWVEEGRSMYITHYSRVRCAMDGSEK
jgi:hypothetical protein